MDRFTADAEFNVNILIHSRACKSSKDFFTLNSHGFRFSTQSSPGNLSNIGHRCFWANEKVQNRIGLKGQFNIFLNDSFI